MNPLSKQKKSHSLTIEDSQLVYQDEQSSWTPRSLLAVLDGLSSIKWAMTLVEWGGEADVEKFFAWLTQRARSRPQRMEQFNTYFTAISWQLCMDLRSGLSFQESTNKIMNDMDRFAEHMSREGITKDPPKKQPNPPTVFQKGQKGYGKNSKSGPSYRSQPYRQQWQQRPPAQDQWYNKTDWYNKDSRADPAKQEWKNSSHFGSRLSNGKLGPTIVSNVKAVKGTGEITNIATLCTR